jgi:protein-disulfide isomerase
MRLKDTLEVGSAVIVAVVAVVVGTLWVADRSRPAGTGLEDKPRISDWEEANSLGIRTGPRDAPFVVTVFVDFECPYCSGVVPRVDGLLREFPEEVAIVFHHLPLSGHANALPAAIAAECADRQGRFWEMYRALFAGQDSLGERPWLDFASAAAVPDIAAFEHCLGMPPDSFPRIAHGESLAQRAGIDATPTVWLNGRVAHPNLEAARRLITEGH